MSPENKINNFLVTGNLFYLRFIKLKKSQYFIEHKVTHTLYTSTKKKDFVLV